MSAGQFKEAAPSRSAVGKSATVENPARLNPAPDRHRNGQDQRLGARKRKEQVAARQRKIKPGVHISTTSPASKAAFSYRPPA